MLYGIQTGFGSPQVPVAELLARPAPTLMSPQSGSHRPKSSNFLQVPDIESPRPKSVPSSPMVKRAFSRLGTITAGWGRSIRSRQNSTLQADDKKKWASSQDCSSKNCPTASVFILIYFLFSLCVHNSFQIRMARTAKMANSHRINWVCHDCRCAPMPRRWTVPNWPRPNSISSNLIRTHFVYSWIICIREAVRSLVSQYQVILRSLPTIIQILTSSISSIISRAHLCC